MSNSSPVREVALHAVPVLIDEEVPWHVAAEDLASHVAPDRAIRERGCVVEIVHPHTSVCAFDRKREKAPVWRESGPHEASRLFDERQRATLRVHDGKLELSPERRSVLSEFGARQEIA